MFKLEKPYQYLFFGAATALILLYFLTMNVPFFWDAYSKSIRATWFLDNHFSQWVLPTDLNAGHPPLWELLLAFTWKLTERTLEYSRLLLLVFNLAAFYQLIRFLRDHKFPPVPFWAMILVLIEPTLIAQTTILNNDMMLLFFTLLGLNAIYRNEKIFYTIALTGVLFSNLRGTSVFASLLLIDLLFYWFQLKRHKQEFLWISYIFPVALFGLFFLYHHQLLGWALKKPGLEHRELAGLERIFKNIASIGKSVLETGRIFMFGLLAFLLIQFFKKQKWINLSDINKRLMLSFLVFFMVFSTLFTLMKNPVNPRYYMVVYLIASLLCVNLIFEFIQKAKWQKISMIYLFIGFLTGHLWIYPPTLSQGWDTSLAYLNYFPVRNKMENYLVKNNISKEQVGTNLNLNHPQFIDLKSPPEVLYSKLDTSKNPYIILSNIENTTSNEDIRLLMNEWILIRSYQQMGVFVNLYKNPAYEDK